MRKHKKKPLNNQLFPKLSVFSFQVLALVQWCLQLLPFKLTRQKVWPTVRPHLGTIRRIYEARKTVCNRLNNSARQVSFTKEIHVMVTGASQDMISFNMFISNKPRSIFFCLLVCLAPTLGLYSSDPAHSCKEMRDLGLSRKDGKYWIDPEKNGNPLKVFCDMTTDGGML